MHLSFARGVLLLLLPVAAACGASPAVPPRTEHGTPPVPPSARTSTEPTREPTPDVPAEAPCPEPSPVLAKSGEGVARPRGSVLRLLLVYEGPSIGVQSLRGVDKTLGPSDGPFQAGKHSGYWVELRDGKGAILYTRSVQDPTEVEGPGPGRSLVRATRDRCEPKLLPVDLPNVAAGKHIVVFGTGYGPPRAARELSRFGLE